MWIKSLVGVVSRFHQKPQENQLEGVENQYQDMEEKVVVIKRSLSWNNGSLITVRLPKMSGVYDQ